LPSLIITADEAAEVIARLAPLVRQVLAAPKS
jgi:hypothetical protein